MNQPGHNVWKRRFYLVSLFWVSWFVFCSWPVTRAVLIVPLCKHDDGAKGEIAYVMAGGPSYWERLRAASDLYHLEKVSSIVILNETTTAGYHFQEQRSLTKVELANRYLISFGVPENKILRISLQTEPWFGTLGEAEAVAKQFADARSLVVVTSAPHTRRSWLAFRRAFAPSVSVAVFSASDAVESDELYSPIWLEYTKLFVYFFIARSS